MKTCFLDQRQDFFAINLVLFDESVRFDCKHYWKDETFYKYNLIDRILVLFRQFIPFYYLCA